MKIQVLSDLHLEFDKLDLPKVDADVVVLAGDIDLGLAGLEWAKTQFDDTPVVYVLGNHEYYHHGIPQLARDLKEAARGSTVHVLENEAVAIDGVTFLGCTLWASFELFGHVPEATARAAEVVNDYRYIKLIGDGDDARYHLKFQPLDAYFMHRKSLEWLEKAIPGILPNPAVIVTHHVPTLQAIPPEQRSRPTLPAHVSPLDAFIAQCGARLWIHGHSHSSFDGTFGATRVVCNPRGVDTGDGCNRDFNPGFTVEIG